MTGRPAAAAAAVAAIRCLRCEGNPVRARLDGDRFHTPVVQDLQTTAANLIV